MRDRTPEEWLREPEFRGTTVLDPDGWRGIGAPKWTDRISLAEFRSRLMHCTVIVDKREASD